jgi:hypothetical protein
MATDVEAVAYLMLCNQMLHDVFPGVTTIGEDVSGMPTFCRSAPAAAPPARRSLTPYPALPYLCPCARRLARAPGCAGG